MGADQDYWLRAAWSGCRFRYCPGSLCFYRKRSGQLSSNPRGMVLGMESVLIKARAIYHQGAVSNCGLKRLARVLFYLAVSEREPI